MPHHIFTGKDGIPGINPVVETFENEFLFGSYPIQQYSGLVISQEARDVGNTINPQVLRQGLLLGKVEETQELKEWTPNASDGSEYIWGILNQTISLRSIGGQSGGTNNTESRLTGYIVISGGLLTQRIIIPGSPSPGILGNANEYLVRALLRENFILSDSYQYSRPNGFIQTLAASDGPVYTVSLNDSGKEFHSVVPINAVLPDTPSRGLTFGFYNEGSTTVVTSGSANIRVPGSGLANSLSVDTPVTFCGTGTEWLVKNN